MPEACHNYPFQALRPVPILPALFYQLPYLWLWLEPAQPRSEPCVILAGRVVVCFLLSSSLPFFFFLFPSICFANHSINITDIRLAWCSLALSMSTISIALQTLCKRRSEASPLHTDQAIHTSDYVHGNTHQELLPSPVHSVLIIFKTLRLSGCTSLLHIIPFTQFIQP